MFINARLGIFLFVPFLFTAAVSAQQSPPRSQPGGNKIYLDVVVTAKSGPPVTGLQQQDFTLIDNKAPKTITSFRALGADQAPIEVIVVVDAVNSEYQTVAYAREQIDKVLRADGGRLVRPTALAFVTDTGTQIAEGFSSDGNALSTLLEQYTVGLRNIPRSTGIYGAAERFQLSLQALDLLAARETPRPGRKLVLWVSPGWPLLTGPRIELDSKQQQQLFASIVGLSTRLRQARITLYSIDPLGADESQVRASYYKEFVKGVREANQVQPADLALQVIATQSGGLALDFNNDVAALLQRCLADTQAYYELSFDPPPADQRDAYHHLEIKLAKPGLTARSRQGYYVEPSPR
jgi:VWFA-related protein